MNPSLPAKSATAQPATSRSAAWKLERLDVAELARQAAKVAINLPLSQLERLASELASLDGEVVGELVGSQVRLPGGAVQVWLNLRAQTAVRLVCQRCLEPMTQELALERQFRFVADEQRAAAEDEAANEDVLVLTRSLDAIALIEDELLMALPLVPMHDRCPTPLNLPPLETEPADNEPSGGQVADDSDRPNPFAALKVLKKQPGL